MNGSKANSSIYSNIDSIRPGQENRSLKCTVCAKNALNIAFYFFNQHTQHVH